MKKYYSKALDETCFEIEHKSGLRVLVFPKEGQKSSYAVIGTRYGSVNSGFYDENGELVKIPDGTAHFLEHKLFEGEKEGAFERYAKTGADANAYTSFDKTAYLFSATENFYESLGILLDLVSSPYLTEENVAKEQGIIGQEIEMYDDNPDWQAFFGAISAAYKTHPIKKDIAGTKETIAVLTPELLYKIYNHFYSAGNMTLCVAGKVNPEKVEKIVNERCRLKENVKLSPAPIKEEKGVSEKRIYKEMAVSKTLFGIAVKGDVNGLSKEEIYRRSAAVSLALDLVCGGMSRFYNDLYENNVMTDFAFESLASESYFNIVLTGVSDEPERVYKEFFESVEKLLKDGPDEMDFEAVKRNAYGKFVFTFDSTELIANGALQADFLGFDLFKAAEVLKETTADEVLKAAAWALSEENAVMAVITPEKKGK